MERNVYCLNKISPVGLKTMSKNYKVVDALDDKVSAILVRSAAMHEMELPESVLCVARAGAGVNNIPLDKFAEKGIVVFNTPGANANAVKELTIAMMLLAARDLRGSMEWVKANKEDPDINKTMEKAKAAYAGTEIMGKTLGVIGCGAIGALVADAASKLGMKVIAVEPSNATRERNASLLENVKFVEYDELYRDSDYITVHVPLLDATRGMLNAAAFSKMKDGVIIINAARDALVNDSDLEEAIKSGKVRKYVTDFPNAKTANMEGVVAIENGNLINSVNFPSLSLGAKHGMRAVVLHKNDPEISAKILKELNSSNYVSGVKGNFGAIVADVAKEPGDLLKIPGVIKVYLAK